MTRWIVLYLLVLLADFGLCQDVSEMTTEAQLKEGEKRMSEYILQILEHYKQPDPVGIPGIDIPEPYPVADTKNNIYYFCTLDLKNMAVYGLRNFQISALNIELASMEVKAEMIIKKIQARGNYSMVSWVTRAQGPFTVNVIGLKVAVHGHLKVKRDGKICAHVIQIDIKPEEIKLDIQNMGQMMNMLQGINKPVGLYIFDYVKPIILKEAYTKARDEINKHLEEVAADVQFPNSISPLDMVIAEARKIVRHNNMEPYKIKDYNGSLSIFSIELSHIWIMGISSFHRVGNVTLKIENNTVIADFEVGTHKLEGTTEWKITAVSGLMSRRGAASFSVEYIRGRIVLAQAMNTQQSPQFRDLQLEVGNIQLRCNGAGTMDYIMELVVNLLPNLMRYQIMDAIERPLKEKVQLELNRINVEELIKQKLPEVDEMQKTGFKLSTLVENTVVKGPQEIDDFFAF